MNKIHITEPRATTFPQGQGFCNLWKTLSACGHGGHRMVWQVPVGILSNTPCSAARGTPSSLTDDPEAPVSVYLVINTASVAPHKQNQG